MDECNCSTTYTAGDWSHDYAHKDDKNGEQSSELVLPECPKSDESGYHVDKHSRTKGPNEYVFPHITERVQGGPLRQKDDLLECLVHVTEHTACVGSTLGFSHQTRTSFLLEMYKVNISVKWRFNVFQILPLCEVFLHVSQPVSYN